MKSPLQPLIYALSAFFSRFSVCCMTLHINTCTLTRHHTPMRLMQTSGTRCSNEWLREEWDPFCRFQVHAEQRTIHAVWRTYISTSENTVTQTNSAIRRALTALLNLIQSKWLPVARVDDSDVQRFHPLEPSLQCLSVVVERGDRRVGPVLKEVSAEERLLIGQNCGG